jgi:poly(hydroxyalkanoate) depolymerase family esterase
MNPDFQRLMDEATRLTREGKLQAATAVVQAAMRGGAMPAPASNDASDVIDVEAREVPDSAPGNAGVPAVGRFIPGSYADTTGHRDYKLYVPPSAEDRPLPLVVMLHGCTQSPDDFAAGTAMNAAALALGFFVLYPAQSSQANPQRCWNWFKHNHQERGRGEPALIAGMTRDVMAHYAIDPDRVYVAGLSAGGAMAAILGDTYPDLYAAVGVHSGLAAHAASDLSSALAAMNGGGADVHGAATRMPTIVFHGDADTTVHPANGEQVIAASVGTEGQVESKRIQGGAGRDYTRRVHRAADGQVLAEHWLVHGAPHAWSGGSAEGSYTDGRGPDASAQMLRFFFEHPRRPVN